VATRYDPFILIIAVRIVASFDVALIIFTIIFILELKNLLILMV
jgi:hypothetical protein